VASGGIDGRIRLWASDGRGEAVVLEQESQVRSLVTLPDGRLASGGSNGEIKIWLVDEDDLLGALCRRVGRNLSQSDWTRYIGVDAPWQPSCRTRPSNWRTWPN
jgi:WD40 repeat protein